MASCRRRAARHFQSAIIAAQSVTISRRLPDLDPSYVAGNLQRRQRWSLLRAHLSHRAAVALPPPNFISELQRRKVEPLDLGAAMVLSTRTDKNDRILAVAVVD